jgi:hypothetical protein
MAKPQKPLSIHDTIDYLDSDAEERELDFLSSLTDSKRSSCSRRIVRLGTDCFCVSLRMAASWPASVATKRDHT